MTADRQQRVLELLERVLETDAPEREAFLAEACGGDPALRAELDGLLGVVTAAGGFLAPPADLPAEPPATLEPGQRLGAYVLAEEIGRGGMGRVFRASQERPRRDVAVKVLEQGARSADALRRFRDEAELLARLRHPAVAQVYEAGVHAAGPGEVPWFAMELVPGARTLLAHARESRLDLEARLALFRQVCDAVHHAHLNGVIHRDLKPANVLVDEAGRPKVIDFGVALRSGGDPEAATHQTADGALVGTLRYMSPEQVSGERARIDARTDVYSLGVCLYELLCDRAPFELGEDSVATAARRICEETPRRPGTISPGLSAELDWICLRALEKEPERRYASAAALADDLVRFRDHLPVEAGPPTALYRLRKLARRHRVWFGAAGLVLVVAAIGVAGIWRGLIRARAAESDAEVRANQAKEVSGFLMGVFIPAGLTMDGRGITIAERLDEASAYLETGFADTPRTRANLEHAVGVSYHGLGDFERAEALLRSALDTYLEQDGEGSEVVLQTRSELAATLNLMDRKEDAIAEARRAIETSTRDSKGYRYALSAWVTLASALHSGARFEEAERELRVVLEEAAAVGDESMSILVAHGLLGEILLSSGRIDEAEGLIERSAAGLLELEGERDHATVQSRRRLALLRSTQGRADEAVDHLTAVLEACMKQYGADHPRTLAAQNDLAALLDETGDVEGALELSLRTLEVKREVLGEDHDSTRVSRGNHAQLLHQLGRHEEAEVHLVELLETSVGAQPADLLSWSNNLAGVYTALERWDEAEGLLRDTWAGQRSLRGDGHRLTLRTLSNLCRLLTWREQLGEAEGLYDELIATAEESLSAGHPDLIRFREGYAFCLANLGDLDAAEDQLRVALEEARALPQEVRGPMEASIEEALLHVVGGGEGD